MDTLQNRLSPKDAGVLGVALFKEIMPLQSSDRVLLEGLNFDDENNLWEVTIGFDTFRILPETQTIRPRFFGQSSAVRQLIESMAEKKIEQETVREFRTVYLKATDGSFVKMDNR